jgi:phosphoribosylaminoimidazole carboxylase (NCAIR synthetase)
MTRPRLLLIGMGIMGRPYVTHAHELGFAVSVVDFEGALAAPDIAGTWQPDDRRYPLAAGAGAGEDAWYAAASQAVRDQRPDAVVGFAEPHVITAALIATELRLPGPGLHAATVSRNKHLQRVLFERYDIRQPRYRLCAEQSTAEEWAAERYPVVLKPLSESGSKGVQMAPGQQELKEWAAERDEAGPFLVEEYADGPEYSCEVVVDRTAVVFANVTAKTTTSPPYCVELSHQVPADLPAGAREAIVDQARQVVAALGMSAGLAHVEMRLTAAGPCLMEVAVRTPGDLIMDLVATATGVDLFDAVIQTAADRRPAVEPTCDVAAAIWFPLLEPGIEVPVERLRRAESLPGVTRVDINPQGGPIVPELRSSVDRMACVLLTEPDPATLRASLRRVQATIGLD